MPKYIFFYRGERMELDYPNHTQAMQDASRSFEVDTNKGYWRDDTYEPRKWTWTKHISHASGLGSALTGDDKDVS